MSNINKRNLITCFLFVLPNKSGNQVKIDGKMAVYSGCSVKKSGLNQV